jgi:alkylation response protein AidB-like acyl-CoA dehydrogenase
MYWSSQRPGERDGVNVDLGHTAMLTREQDDLRLSLRGFLASAAPMTVTRRYMAGEVGWEAAGWRRAVNELGVLEIGVPPKYGGAGAGFVEQCLVMVESGRSLWPGPYFATAILTIPALLRSSDESACRRYLPDLVCGRRTGTLAIHEPGRGWDVDHPTTTARRNGTAEYLISGTKSLVIEGSSAGVFLTTALIDDKASLFAVEPGTAISVEPTPALDPTRPLATVTFTDAPGVLVAGSGAAIRILNDVLDRAKIALGAEQLGGAERCLELAVDYANTRLQFQQPIGRFQSIKHLLADVYVNIEAARTLVVHAARAVAEGSGEVPLLADMVKAWCSETYFAAAATAIQVHGAIGFTWECDAHLYFKRAEATRLIYGDPAAHRASLADRLPI